MFQLHVCQAGPGTSAATLNAPRKLGHFDDFSAGKCLCIAQLVHGILAARRLVRSNGFKPHTRGSILSALLQTVLSKAPDQSGIVR